MNYVRGTWRDRTACRRLVFTTEVALTLIAHEGNGVVRKAAGWINKPRQTNPHVRLAVTGTDLVNIQPITGR